MITEEKKELIKQEKINLICEKSTLKYDLSKFTISLEGAKDKLIEIKEEHKTELTRLRNDIKQ